MDKQVLATSLLEKIYEEVRINDEYSKKIRNWCITVWMGAIALVAYGKIDLNNLQKILFPFIPVLVFWVLDAFQNTFASLNARMALKLEKALANEGIDQIETEDLFYMSAYKKLTLREKIRTFLWCMVAKETVTFFYAVLIVVTFLFAFGID